MPNSTYADGIGALGENQVFELALGGNVLIVGATGTGKSNLAQFLYQRAARFARPALMADSLASDLDDDKVLGQAGREIVDRTVKLAVVDHLLEAERALPLLKAAERADITTILTADFVRTSKDQGALLELCPNVVIMDPFGATGHGLLTNTPLGGLVKGFRDAYLASLGYRRLRPPTGPGWALMVTQDGFLYGRVPLAVKR